MQKVKFCLKTTLNPDIFRLLALYHEERQWTRR